MIREFPQKIMAGTKLDFKVEEFGLYALTITASCEKGHDLKVEIDGQRFREIPPEKNIQNYDIPVAWNGTKLKGLEKTVVFLLGLNKGEHTVEFFPREEAILEDFKWEAVFSSQKVNFEFNRQAKDGDRRPWFTFALIDLPLASITAAVSTAWHWFDGDDVKLVIDNDTEKNARFRKWKDWVWHATPGQIFSGPKREEKTFTKDLPKGVHYLEFWADKTPTLHGIKIDLGDFELKRKPTRDDPKWTGDFKDDTDAMLLARLIFGEARNQSKEAMLGVGWTIENRLNAKRTYFGFDYHEIILKNTKGVYQFSSFDPDKDNFPILIDPLKKKDDKRTHQSWLDAYNISESIISGATNDPTDGATFFHSEDLSQETFLTKSVPGAIFIKKIGAFIFYQDPNEK